VRAIRKTPIVVNDSRGFYTSRVVGTYIREGHLMLTEGVPAAMIENVGRQSGMPVGPLSLNDEGGGRSRVEDPQATEADLGAAAIDPRQKTLLAEMVDKRGRFGRKNGKGFYDYPASGPKRLWPGPRRAAAHEAGPGQDRRAGAQAPLLAIQALETARCFEEEVLTDVREADVGSILGFGYAPLFGRDAVLHRHDGAEESSSRCARALSVQVRRAASSRTSCWSRWRQKGESFYTRFAPKRQKAAALGFHLTLAVVDGARLVRSTRIAAAAGDAILVIADDHPRIRRRGAAQRPMKLQDHALATEHACGRGRPIA
jgi:3-hydroxyacyl-CoA dehydrogenase/enoyl-CoA hydratase/3-hydroxybutyryl-CoA epimerase